MAAETLVRKVHMDCPLCDHQHEVEERQRLTTTIIKGVEVEYKERYYYCANAKEDESEFECGSMINENLLNARNAYRVKKGLLTSDEIVEIRREYGLTQVELARLLGWGEATIARYESKAIQDESYDLMLRLIKNDPLTAFDLLKKNADKFQDARRTEIRSRIIERINSHGKEYLTRRLLQSEYVLYSEPSEANGFTVLDIDKIEAVISYFEEKSPELQQAQLLRMLRYADALTLEKRGRALTGIVYKEDSAGICPLGRENLLKLRQFKARNDDAVLSVEERKTLDKVLEEHNCIYNRSQCAAHDNLCYN